MTSGNEILVHFEAIGVTRHEVIALAYSVDFGETVAEDDLILLRDVWARCKRGQSRAEAFWPWIDDGQELDDLLF